MTTFSHRISPVLGLLALAACAGGSPEPPPTVDPSPPSVVGRWDVTVDAGDVSYPSWFELSGGSGGLTGRFVGRFGSARPIAEVAFDGEELSFRLPPQYERRDDDLEFVGRLLGDEIEGETKGADGQPLGFVARRAPELARSGEPAWGEPIDLLAGGREGWRLRDPAGDDGWKVEDGVLINVPPSADIVTEAAYGDFELSLEFFMPEKSNSGIYLRGRYEVQVQDDHGQEPGSRSCGGVYGFLTPSSMACRPAGEWNRAEITLIGRRLTVAVNGETVIDDAEIPGITGGALDSDEGAPGPLMLQGDHEAVRYRNVMLTPAG